jgi:dTMP kinase
LKRGLFITLEGIEGVGKSSQLDYISSVLQERGFDCIRTREPGGTMLGEAVRNILLHGEEYSITPQTELMLMFSARCQHIQQVILPALTQGQCVICDRFTDASYAYQGAGRGISEEQIKILEHWVQGGLRPDLTLLFDASVETGLKRAKDRGDADRFESEELEFFNRVRAAYLDRARCDGERIKVINAELSMEDVKAQLSALLREL